jgi:hypothetical protein
MGPNTKRKTKNNKKTRKIKGGFWCMFEHEKNQNCLPINPVHASSYYYYFLYEDTFGEKTLFAYKPHIFKHFDEIYPNIIPEEKIAVLELTGRFRGSYRIKFHKNSENRPGNLQAFIDEFNEYIRKNDLSYTKLLATNNTKSKTMDSNNKSVILDSDKKEVEIWWQKKKKPIKKPLQIIELIDDETYNSKINYCIQITHIHDYDINKDKNNRSLIFTTPTPIATPTPVTTPITPIVNSAKTSFDFKIEDNKNQEFINTIDVNQAKQKFQQVNEQQSKKNKALEEMKRRKEIKSSSK